MPLKRERIPKLRNTTCEWCKRPYTAFRKTSRFCSDRCRARARHDRLRDRNAILERAGYKCEECRPDQLKAGAKLIVRRDPRYGDIKRTLCGRHVNALLIEGRPQKPRYRIKRRLKKSKI